MYLMSLNYTLKMTVPVNFMLRMFYHNEKKVHKKVRGIDFSTLIIITSKSYRKMGMDAQRSK